MIESEKTRQFINDEIYNRGFKSGYLNGFERGLAIAKYCKNCEVIKDCPDCSPKAEYCPHSEIHRSK